MVITELKKEDVEGRTHHKMEVFTDSLSLRSLAMPWTEAQIYANWEMYVKLMGLGVYSDLLVVLVQRVKTILSI